MPKAAPVKFKPTQDEILRVAASSLRLEGFDTSAAQLRALTEQAKQAHGSSGQ